MRRRTKNHTATDAPENMYALGKTAGWLLRSLEQKTVLDSCFFECLQWVIGDLRRPLQELQKEAQIIASKSGIVPARKAIKKALASRQDRLANEFADLYEDHPCLSTIILEIVKQECQRVLALHGKPAAPYSVALKRLEQTFGINIDCQNLCEFVFINQNFSAVESYFECRHEVQKFGNRRILAGLLDMTPACLQSCLTELIKCGLFETSYNSVFRLADNLLPFWEQGSTKLDGLFSRPLAGKALPLQSYLIAQDDIAHVKKLLECGTEAPVHILFYGPPGTGKSSFALSLAKECQVKAWAVTSSKNDNDDDRRASLTSCLHMASTHKGAFVLVDEAERLLDTRSFGRQTKDKAWLNDFLEQPGQRIIWITNHIRHVDPAVRRRFSFSIHFERLGAKERKDVWRQILATHRVTKRIDDAQLDLLVKTYPVEAAVIQGAVSQAKALYKTKKEFFPALERFLRSQATLQRDGQKQRIKPKAVADFTLDGVCLEGSPGQFMEKCRRVDAAMRGNGTVRPGCGTMLFYGPPGTGKTALARYIAKHLDRECLVKKASDLLDPYVGGTEQQIAYAFVAAERNDAVLIIDEADSFLYSRDIAQRSWETSFVNEFLTQLEECRCFCICTTNRRDNLDAAAMRRFSHKITFTYAGKDQVLALYASLLAPICGSTLPSQFEKTLLALDKLTPGDFHAVRSQYDALFVDPTEVSHQTLVKALTKEQALKMEQNTRRIGFGG